MSNRDYGDGPEFVLGSYKTLRAFTVVLDSRDDNFKLVPTSTQILVYPKGDEWYTAECSKANYNLMKVKEHLNNRFDGNAVLVRAAADVKVHASTGTLTPYVNVEYYIINEPWVRRSIFASLEPVIRRLELPITEFWGPSICSPPNKECKCGFYSFYTPEYLRLDTSVWRSPGHLQFVGVVENAGRLLHGTYGVRSERMRIKAISPFVPIMDRFAYNQVNVIEEIQDGYYSIVYKLQTFNIVTARILSSLSDRFLLYDNPAELLEKHPIDGIPDLESPRSLPTSP